MNKDLLPCPFCGGEAQLFQRYPRLWNVQCEKCSVVMDPCQRSVEACKEEWNTRAESSTLSTLSARVEELEAGLKPFATFAERYDSKPLRGMGDELYGIHSGTEWEANLRLSDCRRARSLLSEQLS